VALKMILAGGHASAADRARFQREAEAVATLRHPNIVQIYAVGESGGLPYCALEFIEFGNLAEHAAGKPLPPERAAALVEQLAGAVHFAHECGIVHRDLKPANVLLDADGTPKIADFGLAKKLGSATGPTATGAVLGTPAYMAPEQAGGAGKSVGPAADIYALGAILYELLTGRPPFQAATPLETILQVVKDEPPPPRAIHPNVPRDLETVTLKCLRKEPDKRYTSSAELVEDLRRWRSGEPVTARPQGRGERLWRGVKRRRSWVIAGAMTVLVFLVVKVLQWANPSKPPDAPVSAAKSTPATAPIPQPAPGIVTAASVEEAKRDIVAVRSTRAGGSTVGTGFLTVMPGVVVTTLSFLNMDHPLTPPPDGIEVAVDFGQSNARTLAARLLSVDRTERLASLQVIPIDLPPPLALGRSVDVRDGQAVTTIGVENSASATPTGWTKTEALWLRPCTVTGRTASADGSVTHLQLGNNNPSGAALIASDGRLVGVVARGSAGANARIAIPAESVGWVLRERVVSLRLGQSVVSGKTVRIPVTARAADPLNRLMMLALDVWWGDEGMPRPATDTMPAARTGDDGKATFRLSPRPNDPAGPGEDRDFIGTLDLPPLPPGKVYWVQPRLHASPGIAHWGQALPLPDLGPTVERVPVRMALNAPAWLGERRLDMSGVRRMSINITGRPDVRDDRDVSVTVAEESAASGAGLAARLRWRFPAYRINAEDMNPAARTMIDGYVAGLIKTTAEVDLSSEGQVAAERPDFGQVDAKIRPQVEGLAREVMGMLRGGHPRLPDRELRPGDTWPTQVPFVYPNGRSSVKGTFQITLTYVGLRDRAGRREAIVEVSGEMSPKDKDNSGHAVGRSLGAYAVDVQSGLVRMARIESDIIFEIEPFPGRDGKPAKTKVGMTYELRFQRGTGDGPPIPAIMPLPNGRIDFRPFVPLPGAASR